MFWDAATSGEKSYENIDVNHSFENYQINLIFVVFFDCFLLAGILLTFCSLLGMTLELS